MILASMAHRDLQTRPFLVRTNPPYVLKSYSYVNNNMSPVHWSLAPEAPLSTKTRHEVRCRCNGCEFRQLEQQTHSIVMCGLPGVNSVRSFINRRRETRFVQIDTLTTPCFFFFAIADKQRSCFSPRPSLSDIKASCS